MAKQLLLILFGLFYVVCCSNAQSDTSVVRQLEEVEIQAKTPTSAFLSTSPIQSLSAERLEKLNALFVSDAVKHFSGVQVKDYGGVGGLKTVSIRSLGANYTTVAYDGISLSDYQTGQIDLGRFSLDNVERITLITGGNDDIFQPAQLQALAGVLNITSQILLPESGTKRKLKTSLNAGSFGLVHPALWYGQVLNETFSVNISGDYLKADGDYPFSQSVGDSIAHRKRYNSDVETLKLEANVAGRFKNKGNLLFKTYYYTSDRGLPGPATFYNDYSGERLYDRNFFTQANYVQRMSKKIDFQANAKFNCSTTQYINRIFANQEMRNRYIQREYYLNAIFLCKYSEHLSFSWANDGQYGNFRNNQLNYRELFPSRTTWLSALSGKYETRSFHLTAKLLSTISDYNHLSPYLGFSVQPFKNIPVRFRTFYKNTFRMPTFGDLYYSIQPNTKLKPENANQTNAGLTYVTRFNNLFPYISFAGDIYHNRIRNKIVAIPRSSMAVWSVVNYGKVEIQGMDLNATAHIQTGTQWLWQIGGTYTYQNALNKTNPESETYNKRIPYTARHSATGTVGLKTSWIELNYNLLYCGKRYYGEDNRPTSQMKPFTEHGVSLLRTVHLKKTAFTFTAECLNLLNEQYEVVHSYPMVGRSFRLGIKCIY